MILYAQYTDICLNIFQPKGCNFATQIRLIAMAITLQIKSLAGTILNRNCVATLQFKLFDLVIGNENTTVLEVNWY